VGTPEYAAPEVFNPPQGAPPTVLQLCALDVYSFCMTLFHVLTGTKPFEDKTNPMEVMFAVAISGQRPNAALLPANLRKIIVCGWSADPDVRPTMLEILSVLSPATADMAEDEAQQKEEENLCIICLDRHRTHILIPCGHWCLCEEHAQQGKCPICRTDVASSNRVFG
jgi:serine/threonine protein kinase